MWEPENYTIACNLFFRLLGAVYFCAFFPFLFQIQGLLGTDGILPIAPFLKRFFFTLQRRAYYYIPTLFWLRNDNVALLAVIIFGCIFSLLLLFGFFPPLCIALLYILYLSIVSTGQDFLGFGWETFLLEITFNAFFLSLTSTPHPLIFVSINFLLFRFHLQAGAVKLQSRDRTWHNLTALSYHYQTQPIPNATAWYIHKAPLWFHKFSCLLMFFNELVLPFGIFGNDTVRLITWAGLVGLQVFIWLTGNFSFLNHMTIALCTLLLSNHFLATLFTTPATTPTPLPLDLFLYAVGGALVLLQTLRLVHHFYWNYSLARLFQLLSPFHIVSRYGIFAVMTTKRYEIVIEGSEDGQEWKEYAFFHKPTELGRRPHRVSPYQPRLDWQIWFLPFTTYHAEKWFQNFLQHLFKGTPEVLSLMRKNPFPDNPPLYLRAVLYDYEFTSWKERKETGNWWKRSLVKLYSPLLKNPNGL